MGVRVNFFEEVKETTKLELEPNFILDPVRSRHFLSEFLQIPQSKMLDTK